MNIFGFSDVELLEVCKESIYENEEFSATEKAEIVLKLKHKINKLTSDEVKNWIALDLLKFLELNNKD
ncbi:MAG: hypothetical protein FWE18_00145 [Alphaproteobacteria bacterium]|nr:hypothetical protein [Alphaproteobacteria bacterium]